MKTLLAVLLLFPAIVQAELKACHSGYWGISFVITSSGLSENVFQASDMGMHVERVTDDLYVGTFYLDDGWYTFQINGEGVGNLSETTFDGEPFQGKTQVISKGSVYFLPEDGIAGFTRPSDNPEWGFWACYFSDFCYRDFFINQVTFPEGRCEGSIR